MRRQHVYVAASKNANLRRLLEALKQAGHQTVFPGDDADAGESGLAAARKAISRSDVVLLVLTEGNSTGAAFEAGLAAALDVPVLVAATPRATLPTSLRSFPMVSVKLGEPARILDALNVLTLPTRRDASVQQDTALGDKVELYRNVTGNESDRISSLSAAIEGTGAIVARAEGAKDDGFDIAVWSEDLISSLGAPVLIEVKNYSGANQRKQIRSALRSQPNGAIGLLVYQTLTDKHPLGIYDPQVLAIQEDVLLHELQARSFAEIVIKLRNSAMHARSEI